MQSFARMWRESVAARVANPIHGGELSGAASCGQARGGTDLIVRIGLWWRDGHIERARWKATTCPALMAYAELACERLESGQRADAASLREHLQGVHPVHYPCADLVARAIDSALQSKGEAA